MCLLAIGESFGARIRRARVLLQQNIYRFLINLNGIVRFCLWMFELFWALLDDPRTIDVNYRLSHCLWSNGSRDVVGLLNSSVSLITQYLHSESGQLRLFTILFIQIWKSFNSERHALYHVNKSSNFPRTVQQHWTKDSLGKCIAMHLQWFIDIQVKCLQKCWK